MSAASRSSAVSKTGVAPQSLGELLQKSCSAFKDRVAIETPEGKGFRAITYGELWGLARRWASGLKSLGLRRGDRICIFSENCLEWALTDWGCQSLGIVAVPIYPTLPPDQAAYIIKDCEAKIVFCGDEKIKEKCKGVQAQVLMLKGGDESLEKVASEAASITEEEFSEQIAAAKRDDLATIIYTSGTTGLPKGAMLPHRCFVWMNEAVSQHIPVDMTDKFLSFLPLPHVFERANGHFLPVSLGATITYSRSLASLSSDLANAQPTIMLVVPRFLEAVMDRITDAIKKEKPMKQRLFALAKEQGIKRLNGQFAPLYPLTDALVGKKIRARTGGKIRFFASGGAAMPRDVYEFFGAFGIKVLQGYGLTETTSGVYLNHPEHKIRPDTVGEPLHGVETRIADDGEILLRGEFLMQGYFHLPKETSEAIDAEGWFHTGDIGEIDQGYLRITDRKKDLLVLGNGKNIAPQPLENKLRLSPHISEAVVLGDGMDSVVALIVPNFDRVREAIHSTLENKALVESPEAKALIKKEIDALNKSLASFEAIRRHAILSEPFSIDGGELTPTMKVKRKAVVQKYKALVESLG